MKHQVISEAEKTCITCKWKDVHDRQRIDSGTYPCFQCNRNPFYTNLWCEAEVEKT